MLAKDTLPGLKPEDVTGLQFALDAFVQVQASQTGGVAEAVITGQQLSEKVATIAGLRRWIQYAPIPFGWPARRPMCPFVPPSKSRRTGR